MLRRLMFFLGMMPLAIDASAAAEAFTDAAPDSFADYAQVNTDEAFHAGPTVNGFRAFSTNLGKSYSLAAGMRITPYLEVGTPTRSSPVSGRLLSSIPEPAGHVLVGGLTRYALAPHWTLSFDMALGVPLLSKQMERENLAAVKNGDDEHVGRAGIKLGYALGRNFRAFTIAEVSSLQFGPPPALIGSLRPLSQPTETSLRLGLSYRF